MIKRILTILLFASGIILSGCRASTTSPVDADVTLTISVEPEPAAVGRSTLQVRVTDSDGRTVDLTALTVRGDMTHAGMTPVIQEIDNPDNPAEVPFEWTMSGDWIITVTATLADGTTIEETFDLSVTSEQMDMDMETDESDGS